MHLYTDYPREATLHELFEAQAARRPDATALIVANGQLTYAELNSRANQVAHCLRECGVGPGMIVGMYLPRGVDAVVGILAILKNGAAYLPIDTADPSRRVREILDDAKANFVLSTVRLQRRLEGASAAFIAIDRLWNEFPDHGSANLPKLASATSLCYVMYTSGSTGPPKGVMVSHRAVVRLVCGTDYIDFHERRTFLLLAPMCFDASTFELWGPLLHGAQLVVAPEGTPDPGQLLSLVEQHRVCTVWLTVGLFNTLVDVCPRIFSHLSQLIIGGETLSPRHVQLADRLLPVTARMVNGYGPTEGTTFTCCYDIPRPFPVDMQSIPIGRPIANSRVYVLDEQLQPVAEGESGELCIGGDGLAEGYLNAPGLTAEKFIPNPFAANERLYRSGDRVRWRDDGNLSFLGRIDDQLKIRGYRVEPAEIERALGQHPAISQCLVNVRSDAASDGVLVAYFVTDGEAAPSVSELRAHLRNFVPEYMLPSTFVRVAAIPLHANGKMARDRFSQLDVDAQIPVSDHVGLRSPEERMLADLWADVLGTTCIGRNDHFVFDLAGNSLLALQLIERVNRRFGIRLTLPDLLKTPTVATMSARVAEGSQQSDPTIHYLSVVRAGRTQNPVICVGFANALPLLQAALPDDVPLWWLKLEGLHAPPYAIRPIIDIASSYAEELAQTAAGELILVGHSFCGLIALELARRLREGGRRVKVLLLEPPLSEAFERGAMFGTVHAKLRKASEFDRTMARQWINGLVFPTAPGFRTALHWTATRLKRRFRKSILRPCLQLSVRLGRELPMRFREWWYYYPQMKAQVKAFKIHRASGPIWLAGQRSYLDANLPAWQALVDGPVYECLLPAAKKHTDLMQHPAAATWLSLVREWALSDARDSPALWDAA
jgi:amino acid adenylation domain-containing protein